MTAEPCLICSHRHSVDPTGAAKMRCGYVRIVGVQVFACDCMRYATRPESPPAKDSHDSSGWYEL